MNRGKCYCITADLLSCWSRWLTAGCEEQRCCCPEIKLYSWLVDHNLDPSFYTLEWELSISYNLHVCLMKTQIRLWVMHSLIWVFAKHTCKLKEIRCSHSRVKKVFTCSLRIAAVCFDALHPSQQFFSHVGEISCRTGWTSTKQRIIHVLLKDTTQT